MRSAGVIRSAVAIASSTSMRGPDVAALLEPRVPGGAHAGELRDLLAAQPGRAPAAAVRQADVLGLQAGAALAQEIRELVAPTRAVA